MRAIRLTLKQVSGADVGLSHAVKNRLRYRYYASAALITEAGSDRAQGWRLAAREIESAVVRILIDALASPATLFGRLGATDIPSEQARK